jgi:predicted nucleotidyltransferase
MSPGDVDRACDQALSALRHALGDDLIALVLYGSAARRPEGPWNDLDFYLIAANLPPSTRERDVAVDRMLGPLSPPYRRSLLSKTPEEFDADVTPLMLDLSLDARILWDRDGWLRARLDRLRDILHEAALERIEQSHGFLWLFGRPPRGAWELDWKGYREIRA